MPDLWSDLLACLAFDVEGSETPFLARNQRLDYHRVFGGQLLAQFVRAASLACPDKAVKSLHSVFPREGRADEPLAYEVTRHHDGRSFGTLTITATQAKGPIGVASVSMHTAEDGLDRQSVEPVGEVPGPDHDVALGLIPWDTRTADDLNATTTGPPEFELWMRTPSVDPELASALAAYATDLTLIGTALRPHAGLSQLGNGTQFTSAVTSHTIWFHRPFTTDQWLLLRQHSPLLANGRSFGRGDILTSGGVLVASYAQEALLRVTN
ncbi:MAG: acyl-CoA thioesterase [Mycobacterium sp.]|nr:acyl-CoA thioesterase [Mycobacterium sp.]